MERLETSLPELAARIVAAGGQHQRRAAVVAAQWAVDVSGVDDDVVRSGLAQLITEEDLGVDGSALQEAVDRLDEIAWSVQDAVDEGAAEPAKYLAAFGQARAAGSVFFAADLDPFRAAIEAVYEASVIVTDASPLVALVEAELSN